MSLLRLGYKKIIVSTLSVLFPFHLSLPLFLWLILALSEVSYHVLRQLRQPASNHFEWAWKLILPLSNLEMATNSWDPEPEPSSYAASRFLTHKNCDCNCKISPNWFYPVSNKTSSCFSETANQNRKSCSWSMRRDNFDLRLHPEPKDWDITGTWTLEPFPKWRVCCPRKIRCWSP